MTCPLNYSSGTISNAGSNEVDGTEIVILYHKYLHYMAHFAEIDPETNVVKRVLVVPDEEEHRGHVYLSEDLKLGGNWIQTSYNARIRKNYAGIGFKYDGIRDAFIPPQPFPSWTLNDDCQWVPPIPQPENSLNIWDEEIKEWKQIK